METLTLAHLAPYMPYELQVHSANTRLYSSSNIWTLEGIVRGNVYLSELTYPADIFAVKPILRPMFTISDHPLADELVTDNEWLTGVTKESEIDQLAGVNLDGFLDFNFSYHAWQKLFEHHFDVFGLIEKGLAISIHDVKQVKP
ncbi:MULTISPECIES: hypothetical protein [unclassified Pedobacter]|uniref:hypothetical protein n=1 Tax=unclassified Pedobacter TaxID=2628915 RepID=UPI00142480EC|nr:MULTISPECIES: hypothetical protein [unclassified Pedobacter]NII81730.1 hypothetical protein [Pedobacter sp. SG908]NMN35734.1 hypothetical protein [Pedobacter sp. SG918]